MKIYIASLEAFTQELYGKYFSMMSGQRQEAVLRMRSPDDRRRSVLGEMLARKAICEISGIKQEDIELCRTEKGKPYCKNVPVFFSISHSENRVVCAADTSEIGVDIEYIRPLEPRIVRITCTEQDTEYIFGKPDADLDNIKFTEASLSRFFGVWTAKEAYFKYLGTGINGLKTISYRDMLPYCTAFSQDGFFISLYSKEKTELILENVL